MAFSKKLHLKAIILGLAAAIILGFVISPLLMTLIFGPNLNGETLSIASLIFGLLATMCGAYLTSHDSSSDRAFNVFIFFIVSEILGLLSLLFGSSPIWYNVVGTFGVALASLFGWYLEQSIRNSRT